MASKWPVIVYSFGSECLPLSDKLTVLSEVKGSNIIETQSTNIPNSEIAMHFGTLQFLQQSCLQEYSQEKYDKT